VSKWLIACLGAVQHDELHLMTKERDGLLSRVNFLTGQVQGLSTRAEISNEITAGILSGKFSDAEALGIMFAGQDDEFQSLFFNGAGKSWKAFEPTSETSNSNEFAQDMQVHYIWLLLDDDGKALVRRFAEQASEVSQ
jgi:hypothetical protein